MFQIISKQNNEKKMFYLVLILFIITEFLDDFLDHILGPSKFHSIIQIFLFLMLFYTTSRIFFGFYKKKITKLIPEELMNILQIIKEEEVKGVLINQTKLRTKLGVTKPTMKKRMDSLIELKCIFFEKDGNDKYVKLTSLGSSFIK